MLKKFLLGIIVFLLGQITFAKTILVQVKPIQKITTTNSKLQEGDNVDFIVVNDVFLNSKLYLKMDEPVVGTITSLKPNNFLYEPASVYIENFVTKNVYGKKVKLDGIIYKKGNDYSLITQFIPFPLFALKGGHVKIKPVKDVFTLYLEDKDD